MCMPMKGRSPNLRHVTGTHRIILDGLFERITLDPDISMCYVGTREKIGDVLTHGTFKVIHLKLLLHLIQEHPR